MREAVLGRPRVGVLAVQGAFVEHEAALADVGAEPCQVRTPADLDGLDGVVIPGGESTTFGLLAEGSGLLAALRRAVAVERLPTFGTCAGLIMLARATTGGAQPLVGGLDVVVERNAYGRQAASFEADVAVPVLGPAPVRAVFIRAPRIAQAGPGVEALARHGDDIVAVRQDHLMATAFHPELTDDRRLHRLFVDDVRAARRDRGTTRGGQRVRAQ
jgi:5'-phosphate synthase pdxT subunit